MQAGFHRMAAQHLLNRYYIISDPGTCRLMASPEVVGFDSYSAMVPPTVRALDILKQNDARGLERVNILTILRGGLNYPMEESCSKCGIMVSDISFMSCERIIENNEIKGLDVKYEKLHTEPDCTLVIGDIIASGQTLVLCLKHVFDKFRDNGHTIRKIVFFTVGGTKAIRIMEDLTADLRRSHPAFEGFECVFYEGIFTVYTDNGVTGVNVPDIDFGWKGGFISPEFRKYVTKYRHSPALLEKCIIYDGGARRYEIDEHVMEVKKYWQDLLSVADSTDYAAFIEEKAGYGRVSFEEWTQAANLAPSEEFRPLYEAEKAYLHTLAGMPLRSICEKRLEQIESELGQYIKH